MSCTDLHERLYTYVEGCEPLERNCSDQKLVRTLFELVALENEINTSKVTTHSVIKYIREKASPPGTKIHDTQLRRVMERKGRLSTELRKHLLGYVLNHPNQSAPRDYLPSTLERFFVSDPLNEPSWYTLEKFFCHNFISGGYLPAKMVVCNSEGTALFYGTRVVDFDTVGNYLSFTVPNFLENFDARKIRTEDDIVAIVSKHKESAISGKKEVHTILLPWQAESIFSEKNSRLGDALSQMKLVVCYDNIDVSSLSDLSIEDIQRKATDIYNTTVNFFLDLMLKNWCLMHRGNEYFGRIYEPVQ